MTNGTQELGQLFRNAGRVNGYADGDGPPEHRAPHHNQVVRPEAEHASSEITEPAVAPVPEPDDQSRSAEVALAGSVQPGRVVGPRGVTKLGAGPLATVSEPSPWDRVLRLFRIGRKPEPDEDEVFEPEYQRVMRQVTWTRSMNIAVMQRAGGDGVTPTALMLGNVLAFIRGGFVGVVEATQAPGALSRIAEGTPRRGLSELLQAQGRVSSAGSVAGYSAPQTSHAAVFGSVSARPLLTHEDVERTREVLDTYYHLTVTDTDHTLESDSTRAVIAMADAVVIPCVRNPQSLWDAVLTVQEVLHQREDLRRRPHSSDLPAITVVVGSDGPGEDPEFAATAAEWLVEQLPQDAVMVHEVPFEPSMKNGQELVHEQISVESRRAWSRVGAAVVSSLLDTPEEEVRDGSDANHETFRKDA